MLKKELVEVAKQHQIEMEQKYAKEIQKAAASSRIYTTAAAFSPRTACSKQRVVMTGSVPAAIHNTDGKTVILNFADYTRAGGLFLQGSNAQEESLCHDSFLFNVLTSPELADYYKWNKAHKKNNLYENRAVYTPDVLFNEEETFDVLTCAAPYAKSAKRAGATQEEIDEAMKSRIRFIHEILEAERADTAILGAYGCGVFGNKSETVAEFFKEEFTDAGIRNVIYAVPGGKNLAAFLKVIRSI